MRSKCEANEKQARSNCTRNAETETKTNIKTEADKSSSVTPEPGRPGGPGRRNPPAERLFFDYDGDRKIHGITTEQLSYWREMYPALDVESELKKASAWLDGNRKNRKVDLMRFIVNWLNKAQDRAPRRSPEEDTPSEHQGWDI